jgi:GNAT superfamily N-acetyltransferase
MERNESTTTPSAAAAATTTGGLVAIEPLSETYFNEARRINQEFLGTTNKRCMGVFPCGWCAPSKHDFEAVYRASPDRCSTYGLAIRTSDRVVIGIVNVRLASQPSTWDETLMHTPQANEAYVDYMAVAKEARGMGAGTKLLAWAEDRARARGAVVLTLGVVNGNPAKRLYTRVGFVDTESFCCLSFCCLGMPHGRCGATMMEKRLV